MSVICDRCGSKEARQITVGMTGLCRGFEKTETVDLCLRCFESLYPYVEQLIADLKFEISRKKLPDEDSELE